MAKLTLKKIKERELIWRSECSEQLKYVELLEEFKGYSTKIKMRCLKCGYEFYLSPYDLKRRKNNNCHNCDALERRKKQEEFEHNVLEKNPHAKHFILGTYVNKRTRVDVECTVCGNKWKPYPCTLYQGSNCPVCNTGRLKTNKQFCNELAIINKDIELLEEYINDSTKILVRCKKCGNEWKVKPNVLLNGHGCAKCKSRHLERIVYYNLEDLNIEIQKTFDWLKTNKHGRLKLDVYIPSKNIAIECQGEQHFEPIDFAGKGEEWANKQYQLNLYRDKLKKHLCSEHGIDILYYTSEKNVKKYNLDDKAYDGLYNNIFTNINELKNFIYEKK